MWFGWNVPTEFARVRAMGTLHMLWRFEATMLARGYARIAPTSGTLDSRKGKRC